MSEKMSKPPTIDEIARDIMTNGIPQPVAYLLADLALRIVAAEDEIEALQAEVHTLRRRTEGMDRC